MNNERINALETALNNEMKEHEFYQQQAAKSSNPVGKAMFLEIAKEELEHYERLKQLHAKWEKEELWPESVPLEVAGSNLKSTLQKVIDATQSQAPGDVGDLEAVRTAINFEAEGVKFYQKLSDNSQAKKEKDFFALLASIENEHLQSLIETEAFFIDPAQWYQQNERSGLDGV
ncbi:MAG: ferritin family protein [Deltaproteobacteria bacterium]|nr:ferritin family protein [Deltaproteobacteria bacterium]